MTNRLKFTKPAKKFTEATPIGCGRLGATVYGDTGTERIALNEDTLWSGCGRDKNNPSAEYLAAARKAVYDGDIVGAEEIVNRYMLGDMSETYLPFGDLFVELPKGEATGYLRTLDMENGVVYTEYDVDGMHLRETCFASYKSQVVSVRFDFSRPADIKASLSSLLRHSVSSG
ncbi:MAG: glycoside hydrolase family 95 protein, partial [Clostridia bacterium]|nr:glycoside hydrolase family 95 protein [Clostridia bacterium]